MTGKRKQFLSRLLRISQLNDQLYELNQKCSRQPAYTKRIKLIQMGQCQINLPQNHSQSNSSEKHNCKVMIVNKSSQNYVASGSNGRSSTISHQNSNASPESSPSRMTDSKQFKLFLEKKRTSMNIDHRRSSDINFVTQIHCETRNTLYPQKAENIQRRRLKQKESTQKQINRKSVAENSMQSNIVHPLSNNFMPTQSMELIQIKQSPKHHESRGLTEQRCFKSSNHISAYANQKNLKQQKKTKLTLMKQINKNYAKPFNPPPKITAKSYIICEVTNKDSFKVVVSYNSKNSQQVASLTKIMTCLLTLELCQKYQFEMQKQQVKIGKYESNIGGTSADLRQGQIYTVKQLLYGLMLPSGNDASLALAVWCGRKLIVQERELQGGYVQFQKEQNDFGSNFRTFNSCLSTTASLRGCKLMKAQCYSRFIREMNEKAKQLKMLKTRYANSHGLINVNNRSTAYDIAVLSEYAMRNIKFREIVSCRSYEGTIKYVLAADKMMEAQQCVIDEISCDQNDMDENADDDCLQVQILPAVTQSRPISPNKKQSRPNSSKPIMSAIETEPIIKEMQVRWQNTHKLLQNRPIEYIGIKTGFTNNAGPCLSSYLSIDNRTFIIIVLNCSRMNLRFRQTEVLKRWLYKHQGINSKVKKDTNLKLNSDAQFDKLSQDDSDSLYEDRNGQVDQD